MPGHTEGRDGANRPPPWPTTDEVIDMADDTGQVISWGTGEFVQERGLELGGRRTMVVTRLSESTVYERKRRCIELGLLEEKPARESRPRVSRGRRKR